MVKPHITIAIDGHSACGKSTLAKDLAKRLGYLFVDSGAMYRAVTLYFIRHNIDIDDAGQVETALESISVGFERDASGTRTTLNGEDVEEDIRSLAVSNLVSPVAALSPVRKAMVAQQRARGANTGIVMDGRDIGTVVFPNAPLKLFITAELDERVRRRLADLKARGIEATHSEIRENILERDHIDSSRHDSPLRKADDAVLLDNTALSKPEQLQIALDLAEVRLHSQAKKS